jgi:hypothetical protein
MLNVALAVAGVLIGEPSAVVDWQSRLTAELSSS